MTDLVHEEGDSLPVHLVKWFFDKVGLETLVQTGLMAGMFGFLVAGLASLVAQLDARMLAWPVFIGALLGWVLAGSRLTGRWAFVVVLAASLLFGLIGPGRLSSPAWQLLSEINQQSLMIQTGLPLGAVDRFKNVIQPTLEISAGLTVLSANSMAWFESLRQGGSANNMQVLALIWSLVLFWIGAWGSWAVRRRGQTLAAALPAGVLLASSLAFSGASVSSLIGFLGMVLLLQAWDHFYLRQRSWVVHQIDYAEDLRLDVSAAAVTFTGILLFVAVLVSLFSLEKIESFLDQYRPVANSSSPGVGEPFGLARRPAPLKPEERKARTGPGMNGLPRLHLLGSGPELSQELVMLVSTGDLPKLPSELAGQFTAPHYYWKAINFDLYTGNGWKVSDTESVSYPPGEATHPGFILFPTEGRELYINPVFRRSDLQLVRQEVNELADLNGLVYSAGELLGIDTGYRARWHYPPNPATGSEGDLYAAVVKKPVKTYRAWSARAQPGEIELRAAGGDYPEWVTERYLNLPETVPQRVLDLAKDLTEDQLTAYDQALAIESYLRKFPYSLDLPVPPVDRDVVDYFLFDLQTGYCDYYASAMVVLARAAGLPARLAVGYASGDYNPLTALYQVTEEDGHSWPEVYFPGLGWVEFEPTAAFSVVERPIDGPISAGNFLQPEESQPEPNSGLQIDWRSGITIAVISAGVCLAAWLFFDRLRLQLLPPSRVVGLIFQRIYQGGMKLGQPAKLGETPGEFANRFAAWLVERNGNRRWRELFVSGAREMQRLSQLYNRSLYSQHPLEKSDRLDAWHSWLRLRWPLRLAKFRRKRF